MTDVTDEMVKIGTDAAEDIVSDSDVIGVERHRLEMAVRAALSAALPLVMAGERERAAKIAENAGLAQPVQLDADQREIGGMIAAAIRADTGGET